MKFSLIFKIFAAILVPLISGLWIFFSSYLQLEASYYTHLEAEAKKDTSIERQLGSIDTKFISIDRKLDTILEKLINDNGNKEKQ